ncbi:thermonuclease family protein [Lysinibacillus sphaericus]|uniref:thermonuclease family protein n=1 Tax=Lysinibacillus sphaericus TaxID=1421 RepID=UPI003F7AC591
MKKVLLFTSILFLLTGCDTLTSEIVDDTKENRKQFGTYISEVAEVMLGEATTTKENTTEDLWEKYSPSKEDVVDNKPISKAVNNVVKATVTKVIDGDTIDVKLPNGETERIRFILVNAPESKGEKYKNNPEPYALEAAAFTKKILKNKMVWLENDIEKTDKYGRTLAYVWLVNVKYNVGEVYYEFRDPVTINELLLLHGYAHIAVYKPNVLYLEQFKKIEILAKENNFGMWNVN